MITTTEITVWTRVLRAFGAVAFTLLVTLICAAAGFPTGNALGYSIAWVTGRDPAELKDMLIWCFISTPLVFAATGIYLSAHIFRAKMWIKRSALFLLFATLLGAASIIGMAYINAPLYGS